MGSATSGSMMEARHGVMMLGEELGVRLPRGITSFLTSIGPVAATMEAAFPFLAIAAGVTLLINHLESLKEKAAEQSQAWGKLGNDSEESLRQTEHEIKQTQRAIEELSGGKLIALRNRLQEIDEQKFDNLEGNLKKVGDQIDSLLGKQQRGSIMTTLFGQNYEGELKAGFDTFRNEYSSLLQSGDTELAAQRLEKEIGAVGKQFEYLKLAATGTTAPGLKEDLETSRALYNQLINLAAYQEDQQDLAGKKKTEEKIKADPDDGGLFVDAQHRKTISIQELTAAIKKEKEAAEKAQEVESGASGAFSKAMRERITGEQQLADIKAESAATDAKTSAVSQANVLDRQYKMGLVSVRDYVSQKIGLLKQEENAELELLQLQERIAQAGLDKANQSGDVAAQVSATKQLEQATRAVAAAQEKYDSEIKNTQQDLTKFDSSWSTYFGRMRTETDGLSSQIRTNLQGSMTRFTDSFSQSVAQSIVHSKNLGQAVRQEAGNMLESVLSMLTKWGLQWLTTHTLMRAADTASNATQITEATSTTAALKALAASLAGTNAVASFSAAPWPIDMGAPAFGASVAAAALAMETGGIVPGVTKYDSVPTLLTPGEAVLPKAMTENLQNAAKFGDQGSGQAIHIHHNPTYHVQAFNSDGVDQVLRDHGDKFVAHAASTLRKMNR